MKNRKLLKIAAGVILLTGLAAAVYYYINSTPQFRWKSGDKQMYSFKLESSVSIVNMLSPGVGGFTQKIDGTLNFRIFEVSNSTVKAGFQISPIKVVMGGKRNEQLEKLYSTFFLAELDRSGKPLSFTFNNSIALEDEKTISNLIKMVQIVIPARTFGNWKVNEEDGTGKYTAEYSIKDNSIIKHKINITVPPKTDFKMAGRSDIDIIKSNYICRYSGGQSWIESINAVERILMKELNPVDEKVAMSTNTSLRVNLEIMPYEPDGGLDIWRNSDYSRSKQSFQSGNKNEVSYWKEQQEKVIESKIAGLTLNSILERIFRLKSIDYDLLNLLKDYLTIHPEEAAKIAKLLLDGKVEAGKAATLIHALELCGSPQAQDTLFSIAGNVNQSTGNRVRSLLSIAGLQNPEPGVIERLLEISVKRSDKGSVDIANTAILALGNLSYTQKYGSPEFSEKINGELTRLLASARDNDEKATILAGMGNARDNALVPEILPNLSSDSIDVRATAAYALRHMTDGESLDKMSSMLENEKETYVKDAILKSMLNRKASDESISTVQDSLRSETDDNVKTSMYRYLINNRENYSSVRDTLKASLAGETNIQNRILIYKGLYSKKKNIE